MLLNTILDNKTESKTTPPPESMMTYLQCTCTTKTRHYSIIEMGGGVLYFSFILSKIKGKVYRALVMRL